VLKKKVRNKLYKIFFIELCCSFCFYKNNQTQHNFIDINDNEALKKENISYENSIIEFAKFSKESIILKEKIENELAKLTNLEQKILNEIRESFKKQHDNLTKIEKELNDDLMKNVTKVKEELENYISQSIDIIKTNEKIGKCVLYFEKNKEKSNPAIIKTLSYISEIEKNNEKIFLFINEPMKNMNIAFNENKNTLEYNKYCFNGICSSINIQPNQVNNCINISWKMNEQCHKPMDFANFRYNIEIKDKNDYTYVFEGKETNVEIRGVALNEEYEIRIRAIYKELYGNWFEKRKIILKEENKYHNPFIIDIKNTNLEVVGFNYINNIDINNPFQISLEQNKNFIFWKKLN